MEAALLPGERTDLVSTNKLAIDTIYIYIYIYNHIHDSVVKNEKSVIGILAHGIFGKF